MKCKVGNQVINKNPRSKLYSYSGIVIKRKLFRVKILWIVNNGDTLMDYEVPYKDLEKFGSIYNYDREN